MQDVETATERLVRAVLAHRTARFTYHGFPRVVEPHLIGIHEAGEPLLVAYQTEGESASGELPGWRTFVTTQIEAVETGPEFPGPRPGFTPEARGMREIFARA